MTWVIQVMQMREIGGDWLSGSNKELNRLLCSPIPSKRINQDAKTMGENENQNHQEIPLHTYWCACGESHFGHVRLFVTLQITARQSPLFTGFPRHEARSGLLCLSPRDLPSRGLNLHLSCLLHWRAGSLRLASSGKPHPLAWLM